MIRTSCTILALGAVAVLLGCSSDSTKASDGAESAKSAEPAKKSDKSDEGAQDKTADTDADPPIEADFEDEAERDIDGANYDDVLAELESEIESE